MMISQRKQDSLNLCIAISKYLYIRNPTNGMPVKRNSIVPFSTKSRLCDNTSMSNDAHYHNTKPHRICIKQKFLNDRIGETCKYEHGHPVKDSFVSVYGNFAIVELMCHELAHHRTKAHGKKWYEKFNRFMSHMSELIISGQFYKQETWVFNDSKK